MRALYTYRVPIGEPSAVKPETVESIYRLMFDGRVYYAVGNVSGYVHPEVLAAAEEACGVLSGADRKLSDPGAAEDVAAVVHAMAMVKAKRNGLSAVPELEEA